jgi:hypothetical protein
MGKLLGCDECSQPALRKCPRFWSPKTTRYLVIIWWDRRAQQCALFLLGIKSLT